MTALHIKALLEERDIFATIRNEFKSGISAGFAGSVPSVFDLYVQEQDKVQAETVVSDFTIQK
jgi:hypothetical protein